MFSFGNKYYKVRIIFTFAVIAIVLVLGMSRISYYFVKDLYLQQLEDQLNMASTFIADELDDNFISLLELGTPTKSLENYFSKQVEKDYLKDLQSEIFIFNSGLEIIFVPDDNINTRAQYPELIFYQAEIQTLELNNNLITIPFMGVDERWYLYSFRKIGKDSYLCIKAPAIKFSRIEEFDNLFWLLGLGGIIAIIIISWFLANSITRPVNRLVKFSRKIGDNKLDSPAPTGMKGELAELSKSMDIMRKNILRNQKERENMLAQIAHEIRNPLGGIELLAGLIKEDLEKEKLSNEYPQKILNEVAGLKKLITSYLNYSKPSQVNPEDIEINDMINNIEDVFKLKLSEKNIEMKKYIEQSKIRFDKDQLKHVVMNLIANSLDAVDQGGKIEITSFAKNGHAILSISDNGTGIEKENIDKLFEPFFTTKKDGIGLGLAISRKYCEENNAEIKIVQNSDKGITFNIIKEV